MEELQEKFKIWCNNFGEAEIEPMNMNLSKYFLQCNMLEMQEVDIKEINKESFYQVIDKRAEFISLKLNIYVKAFLMFLTKSPGTAVMYLYYIKSKQVGNIEMDMVALTMMFPDGFLKESELKILWDKQKIGSSNLLDMI